MAFDLLYCCYSKSNADFGKKNHLKCVNIVRDLVKDNKTFKYEVILF
jgi:hypothetical protein